MLPAAPEPRTPVCNYLLTVQLPTHNVMPYCHKTMNITMYTLKTLYTEWKQHGYITDQCRQTNNKRTLLCTSHETDNKHLYKTATKCGQLITTGWCDVRRQSLSVSFTKLTARKYCVSKQVSTGLLNACDKCTIPQQDEKKHLRKYIWYRLRNGDDTVHCLQQLLKQRPIRRRVHV